MAELPTTPPGAPAAPAAPPAEPAKVDARAAALAVLNGGEPPAALPAPAPGSPDAPGDKLLDPAPPAEPADEPLSPEALRKRGEDLRRGFGKLAAEKASLLAQRQANATRLEAGRRWEDAQAKVKADPAAVLELHGISLEDVASAYLRRAGAEPPTAEDRVARLEEEVATRRAAEEKDATDRAETDRQARVAAGVDVVRSHLGAAPDKYPAIVALDHSAQVFEAVGKYAAQHQLAPADINVRLVDLVAAEYEKALTEELGGLVSKVPHIAARTTQPRQPASNGHVQPGAQGTSSTTLANAAVSEAPPPQPRRGFTKEELRAKALALFSPGANRSS